MKYVTISSYLQGFPDGLLGCRLGRHCSPLERVQVPSRLIPSCWRNVSCSRPPQENLGNVAKLLDLPFAKLSRQGGAPSIALFASNFR